MPLSEASETLVRQWLDRPENRAEWERLRSALSLAEGFQFFAIQVNDPVAEIFLETLLQGDAADDGVVLVGFDLSRPPEGDPILGTLLRVLDVAPRPCRFLLRGGSLLQGSGSNPEDLFLFLNQKRDVIAASSDAPFLLSLSPEGWVLFRQAAPDFWSIHQSVYRFGSAEVLREERVREVSEEAFYWQSLAAFVALRLLRSALPTAEPRKNFVPAGRDDLVGRESEKKTLRTWLATPGARILISGMPGIGKTSLLIGILAEVGRIFRDTFFFSLSHYGGVQRILEAVVEALRPGMLTPLMDRRALQAMYRDVTAERRVLIVLDDVEDLRVLDELAPAPPSSVLAAGRSAPSAADWRALTLSSLRSESIFLLQRLAPDLSPKRLELLIRMASGNPLMLRVLGSLASSSPESLGLTIEVWEKRTSIGRRVGLAPLIEAVVTSLVSDLRRGLEAAAVFQGTVNPENFRAVADLTSDEQARSFLHDLASRGLLERTGAVWFMHPQLRGVILQHLPFDVLETLRRKHAVHHLGLLARDGGQWEDSQEDIAEALRWLALESSRKGRAPDWLDQIVTRIGLGQPKSLLQFFDSGLANVWLDTVAQTALERENGTLATEAVGWSALACIQRGDWDGARERLAGQRSIAQSIARTDLEAETLKRWIAVALRAGQPAESFGIAQAALHLYADGEVNGDLPILAGLAALALGELTQAFEMFDFLAEPSKFSLSTELRILVGCALGRALGDRKGLEEVLRRLEKALTTAQVEDSGTRAWMLALQAELHLKQLQGKAARESVEFSLRQALAAYDREAEAEALRVKGKILEVAGDLVGAESSLRRLLEVREDLFHPEHEGVAWAAQDLARVLWALQRLGEAVSLYLRAAVIFRRGMPATERALAVCLSELGDLLIEQGHLLEAESILNEGLEVASTLLGPRHPMSTRMLSLLAHVAQRAGRVEEAESLVRQSLALQEHTQNSDLPVSRRILAETLGFLADILVAHGNISEASTVLRDFQFPIYKELGNVDIGAYVLDRIADLHAGAGDLDKAIQVREEQLPLYEQAGDLRGLVIARTQLALAYRQRDGDDDREKASKLLQSALKDADALHMPESETIRGLVREGEADLA